MTCNSGEYQPVPGDCESYYACLWGKYEQYQCAPGLHFNAQSHICDWPVRAKCTDNVASATTEIPLDPVGPDYTTQKPWQPPSQSTTALPSSEIDPNAVSPLSGHFKVYFILIYLLIALNEKKQQIHYEKYCRWYVISPIGHGIVVVSVVTYLKISIILFVLTLSMDSLYSTIPISC